MQGNKLSHPVGKYIVLIWMKEAGFRYKTHNTSYHVNRREDADFMADVNNYLEQFFEEEVFEECWI